MLWLKKNFVDVLFSLVAISSITQFNSFLASWMGISFNRVGIFMIFAYGIYFLLNAKRFVGLLSNKLILFWTAFSLVIPLLSFFFSVMWGGRELALLILYYETSLFAVIIMEKQGPHFIGAIAGICFAITLIGGIVSIAAPSWLNVMAFNYLDKRSMFGQAASFMAEYTVMAGRAYGFYLQPNILSEATVFLFSLWAAFYRTKYGITKVVGFAVMFALVIIAASRGGLLLAVACIFLFVLYYMGAGMALQKKKLSLVSSISLFAAVGFLSILAFIFVSPYLSSSETATVQVRETPLERVTNFIQGKTNIQEDASFASRLMVAKQASHLLLTRYPLGRGYDGMNYLYYTGVLMMDVHNQFLRLGLDYGILYLMAYLAFIFWLIFSPKPKKVPESFPAFCIIPLLLLLDGFFTHNQFEFYFFYFTIGSLLGFILFLRFSPAPPRIPPIHMRTEKLAVPARHPRPQPLVPHR